MYELFLGLFEIAVNIAVDVKLRPKYFKLFNRITNALRGTKNANAVGLVFLVDYKVLENSKSLKLLKKFSCNRSLSYCSVRFNAFF